MIKVLVLVSACLLGLAAAQCSYTGPSGTIDLSAVAPAALQIEQVYQGKSDMYTWVVSLCSAVSTPPSGATACTDGPGYISEYSTTACETAWTTQTQGWTYDSTKGAGTASFTNSKGWLATIYVGCGSTPALTAAGKVEVTDSLAFTFLLTTSAACGGAPGPGPGPIPPTPPFPPPNPGPGPGPIPPTPPTPPIGPTPPPGPAPGPEKKKGGMTGGGWFVLALSLTIVLYVSCTIAFYYFKQGKRGKELVPHPEFWATIPGLVKDGCVFTKDKVVEGVNRLRGQGGSDSSYQSV